MNGSVAPPYSRPVDEGDTTCDGERTRFGTEIGGKRLGASQRKRSENESGREDLYHDRGTRLLVYPA